MKQPTICIPRVSKIFTTYDVKNIFDAYKFGNIKDIKIINGTENNKIFIRYSYWNTNMRTKTFQQALNNDEEIKIFYDFPKFWKCCKSFQKYE